jgi:hypothetical protein
LLFPDEFGSMEKQARPGWGSIAQRLSGRHFACRSVLKFAGAGGTANFAAYILFFAGKVCEEEAIQAKRARAKARVL